MKICSIETCDKKANNSKGWCPKHYMRWYCHGDPLWQWPKRGRTRTSISWSGMKQRCDNPNAPDYDRYGGRGITYDPAWKDFSAFLADMGERPHGTTLDRVDVDGNYTKENCRWATPRRQANNRRDNVYLVYKGQRRTAMEWSKETGLSFGIIYWRVRAGWDVERILTTPARPKRPHSQTKLLTM